MNAKRHNPNRAAALLRDRRRGIEGRMLLSASVARVTEDEATQKGVTAALRDKAKALRAAGALGQVKTRVETVDSSGRRGLVYRYTLVQRRMIAEAYKPRKAEYKTVRELLLAA